MDNADGRLLALDVGSKRIGIATANVVAKLPEALTTLEVGFDIFRRIHQLLSEQQAVALVIGLPRGLEGQETDQTRLVRSFADVLKKDLKIPVHWQDEALTSQLSEQQLAAKYPKGYDKAQVDAQAAAIILGDFLKDHPDLAEVTSGSS